MAKVFQLALPIPFKASQSCYPLSSTRNEPYIHNGISRPTPRTSKQGRLTYYKMFGTTAMNFVRNIEGPATANGHSGEPFVGWLEIVDHIFKCGMLDYLSRA